MLFCLTRPDSGKIRRIFEMWGFVFSCRLLYQQQSMWMATCWLSQTTCLYTTIPNTGGGLAALTPQKVRPLLIWKMVGTHLHVLFFYLQCFFLFFYFLFPFLFFLFSPYFMSRHHYIYFYIISSLIHQSTH